ncbi:PAS domain-containing protein [Kineococcus arenarius]|uniref:PAS domain-containing protein n=1 Tax=Kineococcus sp. SYSU DK007 TaxID=3383128 RepID=UPI003D7C4A69
MPGSPPQPLALREEPAAVLLVDLPAGAGRPAGVAAADAAALRRAGATAAPFADLPAFCRAAGLPAAAAERVLAGTVPGELVEDRWWLAVAPLGERRALLSLHEVPEDAAAPAPGAPAAVAGAALTAVPAGPPAGAGEDPDDARGVVEWVGAGWSRVTGVPAGDVVGRGCAGLLPAAVEDARPALRRAARSGEPVAVTVLDERTDGTRFLHRVRSTPLRDRSGAVCHVVTRCATW